MSHQPRWCGKHMCSSNIIVKPSAVFSSTVVIWISCSPCFFAKSVVSGLVIPGGTYHPGCFCVGVFWQDKELLADSDIFFHALYSLLFAVSSKAGHQLSSQSFLLHWPSCLQLSLLLVWQGPPPRHTDWQRAVHFYPQFRMKFPKFCKLVMGHKGRHRLLGKSGLPSHPGWMESW